MTVAVMASTSIPAAARRRPISPRSIAIVLAALVLAACSSPKIKAPVEDRGGTRAPVATAGGTSGVPGTQPATAFPAGTPDGVKPLPGAENAGKPGFYTVKPGDTMIRVGLETGQNWKDLIKWNNLDNPNVIEVGQVLRVVPPGADPNAVATRGVTAAKIDVKPLDAPRAASGASGAAGVSIASTASTPVVVAPAAAAAPRDDDDINWQWPATGTVVAGFDDVRSKGLSISGKAGDPVLAAADGRVVYAGSGLRGYGNLVILKHNSTFLTAYAHNQALLVKEDQTVRRGQKIAEMGATDSDRVLLHFEIRKLGRPIDPAKLLPPR
jgi:lipoprotein NlpD